MKKNLSCKVALLLLQCFSFALLFIPGMYECTHLESVTGGWALGDRYQISFLDKALNIAPTLGCGIIVLMCIYFITLLVWCINKGSNSLLFPISVLTMSVLQLSLLLVYNIFFWNTEYAKGEYDWKYYVDDLSYTFIVVIIVQIIIEIVETYHLWVGVKHNRIDIDSTAQLQVEQNILTSDNASEAMAAFARIKILKQWLDEGLIAQEEFNRKKQELLGLTSPPVQCRPLIMPIQNIEAMLKKYKELTDCAAITPEEFAAQKAQLLNMI